MRLAARLGALILGVALVFCACSQKPTISDTPRGRLGVAGFTQPRYNWELMAGYLPQPVKVVDKEVLDNLNSILMEILKQHEVDVFVPPARVMQCQEIVVFENVGHARQAALKYWVEVGRCEDVDFLVVPQVLEWRERPGSDWGSSGGAGVNMDIYLVDIKKGNLAGRFHFDETQQPLASNMLEADKFFKRGGKWVKAEQLAREGMEQGLTELGL